MAYTDPIPTKNVGDRTLASDWNTYIQGNIDFLHKPPGARVYNDADLTHNSSGNWFTLTFNSERWDTHALHDTGANTSRLTIPSGGAGKYLVVATVMFAANATGWRGVRFRVNATTVYATQLIGVKDANQQQVMSVSDIIDLAAADYVEAQAFQDSGTNLTLTSSARIAPEFSAQWLRA